MSFVINPYFFQNVNVVKNGDFSNVSGMGVTGGGWYNNTPPSWVTESPNRNAGYSVLQLEGKYYANLNALSSSSVFQPLWQNTVYSTSGSIFTATWTIRSLNGYPYTMGAAFYEEDAFDFPIATYTSPFDANTRTVSLATPALGPFALISFAMWQSGNTAPGVTDLTIYAS
jgi:hypothetical protein